MSWWKSLRQKLELWFATKAIAWAFNQLEAQHLGQKLNESMDASKLGKERSDALQKELSLWLQQVANELAS